MMPKIAEGNLIAISPDPQSSIQKCKIMKYKGGLFSVSIAPPITELRLCSASVILQASSSHTLSEPKSKILRKHPMRIISSKIRIILWALTQSANSLKETMATTQKKWGLIYIAGSVISQSALVLVFVPLLYRGLSILSKQATIKVFT